MSGECDYCGSDQHVETTCPKTKDTAVMWRDGYASGYAAGWNANNHRSAFATPPPGHVIDDTGTVRKVLGTLPVTADGAIACQDAVVWHPVNGACYPVPDGLNVAAKVYGGSTLVPVSECFATREAAEAAREAGGKA